MGISEEKVKNVRNRMARHKERRIGVTKKKVLLLLAGGLALGLTGSPRTYWKIVGEMRKEWSELTKQSAERAINALYASKLVSAKENGDGTFTLIMVEKGRKKALTYDLYRMKIKVPAVWDRQWRLISFDVPVGKKQLRDSLREHLLKLGFYEFQQSVFIHPFNCADEIEYLTELYDARKYVRFFLVSKADNELHLKKFFGLEMA
ncbi:MAG: hypothetical protein Q7R93_05205 [bacterium]|nr:hypothetical protein [bacterium]